MDRTPNDIASGWISYTARCHPQTGDLKNSNSNEFDKGFENIQKLMRIIDDNPSEAIEIIEKILTKTSDPWILENLGAGPIEDLLSNGMSNVPAIEKLAKKHPNAVEALRYVWMGRFSDEVRVECERIISENL